MNKVKKNALICLFSLIILLLVGFGVLGSRLFVRDVAIWWSMVLVLLLGLYEWMNVVFVDRKQTSASAQQLVRIYMMLKGGKVLLFSAIIVFYALLIKVEIKRFVLVAVAIYFIYLLFNTLFLSQTEKSLKIDNSKKND